MARKKDDQPVALDASFRERLGEVFDGDRVNYCYQCGACVGDCPATTYGEAFNPREIMLKVLYGLEDELLGPDSVIWECTNCYACHERCPQQVKPVEVIISMKNLLARRGLGPAAADKVIRTFETTGRTVPYSKAIDTQRERFGLPRLSIFYT